MNQTTSQVHQLGRRAFLKHGTLILATSSTLTSTVTSTLASTAICAVQDQEEIRFGLITDLHYADKAPAGSRHYRETPDKLAEAGTVISRDNPSFVVELGDLIDAADSVETELDYLNRINREFISIAAERHYVLGNHCVHTLTKEEFLDGVEQERSFYSFDSGGFHFIVLDACFRGDGEAYGRKNFEWTDPNITDEELEWLKGDLQETSKKSIVFVHQRLDVSNHYGVKNAAAVRSILETSGKVLCVFQGHSHQNDHNEIGGIHYCTLVAMVEGSGEQSNGYSVVKLLPDGAIELTGYRRQANYDWPI